MVERSVLTLGMRVAFTDSILKQKLEVKIKREREREARKEALAEQRRMNDGYVIIRTERTEESVTDIGSDTTDLQLKLPF